MTTKQIAQILYNNYNCVKQMPNGSGGMIRSGKNGKGNFIQNYTQQCIEEAIILNNLSYKVVAQYKFKSKTGIITKIDLAILNQNNEPIFLVEVKDYTDKSMMERCLFNYFIAKQKHKTIKMISLSMQCAVDQSLVNNYLIELDSGTNNIIADFHLVNLFNFARNKSPTWLLNHTLLEVEIATANLVQLLQGIIK